MLRTLKLEQQKTKRNKTPRLKTTSKIGKKLNYLKYHKKL